MHIFCMSPHRIIIEEVQSAHSQMSWKGEWTCDLIKQVNLHRAKETPPLVLSGLSKSQIKLEVWGWTGSICIPQLNLKDGQNWLHISERWHEEFVDLLNMRDAAVQTQDTVI